MSVVLLKERTWVTVWGEGSGAWGQVTGWVSWWDMRRWWVPGVVRGWGECLGAEQVQGWQHGSQYLGGGGVSNWMGDKRW